MEISLSHVMLIAGSGLALMFLLHNVRLGLRLAVTVAKAAAIVFIIAVLGWLVGLWGLPRPIAIVLYGLSRLWRPFWEYLLDQLRGCLV